MPALPNSPQKPNDDVKSGLRPSARDSLRETVRQAARQIESRIIMDALQKHRWNRRRTAEALNISYRSLMYKMKNGNLRHEGSVSRGQEE
jgi:transcriptional regulator with PAS, ATPase and Fis domain